VGGAWPALQEQYFDPGIVAEPLGPQVEIAPGCFQGDDLYAAVLNAGILRGEVGLQRAGSVAGNRWAVSASEKKAEQREKKHSKVSHLFCYLGSDRIGKRNIISRER
jgi:hypothetical protein